MSGRTTRATTESGTAGAEGAAAKAAETLDVDSTLRGLLKERESQTTARHEAKLALQEREQRREYELKLVQQRDLPTIKLGLAVLVFSFSAGCLLAWLGVEIGSSLATTSMMAVVAAGAYLAGGSHRKREERPPFADG